MGGTGGEVAREGICIKKNVELPKAKQVFPCTGIRLTSAVVRDRKESRWRIARSVYHKNFPLTETRNAGELKFVKH